MYVKAAQKFTFEDVRRIGTRLLNHNRVQTDAAIASKESRSSLIDGMGTCHLISTGACQRA